MLSTLYREVGLDYLHSTEYSLANLLHKKDPATLRTVWPDAGVVFIR